MPVQKKRRPGPRTLFPGKVRTKPVTITLTPKHHAKVQRATQALGITRAELLALLIDKFSESVTKDFPSAYVPLRNAVAALGGTLTHQKRNQPQGGSWVLALGGKSLIIKPEKAKSYPELDKCYKLKEGITATGTWDDRTKDIDPIGLAALFGQLVNE